MTAWQILGIEPTDDESAIKKAYAKQLKHNKPDKNPDGFKALREAYETALATRYYYANDDDDDYQDDDWQDDSVGDGHADDECADDDKANHLDNNHDDTKDIAKPSQHGLIITSYTSAFDESLLDKSPLADDDEHSHDTPYDKTADDSHNSDDDWQDVDNSPHFSSLWYDIDNDDDVADKDQALLDVLYAQTDSLYTFALDERMDYEQALLDFLTWSNAEYSKSYRHAFGTFAWHEIIQSWQIERYPWSRLIDLQERYQYQAPPFSTYGKFHEFLMDNYPVLYNYYYSPKPRNRAVFLWHFIKKSFYPEYLLVLNHDLQKVNELLTRHANQEQENSNGNNLYHNILNHDKEYGLLNQCVNKGVFRPIYLAFAFGGVFLIGSIFSLIIAGDLSWLNRHVLPIALFVFAMMIFWQLRWHLFANPSEFSYQDYAYQPNAHFLRSLYISLPLIFGILSFSFYRVWKEHEVVIDGVTNITELYDKPSYFLAHLAGFGLWWSLMRANRYGNPFVIQAYWVAVFVFLILAVFYPSVVLLTQDLEFKDAIMAYTPLLWVIICLPIGIHLFAHNNKMHWLHPMANLSLQILVGVSMLFMFFAMIYALCLLLSLPLLSVIVAFGIFLFFKSFTYETEEE